MNEATQVQRISAQHPAVVLRSHYQHLRALLAVMLIAVLALTVAVVVLATSNTRSPSTSSRASSSVNSSTWRPGTTRSDGGPEEGTRGPSTAPAPGPANPYSFAGGHEEGQLYISHGNAAQTPDPGARLDHRGSGTAGPTH
jgi:hypothetical protein